MGFISATSAGDTVARADHQRVPTILGLLSSAASFCVGLVLLASALLKAAQPNDIKDSLAYIIPESGGGIQFAYWCLSWVRFLSGRALLLVCGGSASSGQRSLSVVPSCAGLLRCG